MVRKQSLAPTLRTTAAPIIVVLSTSLVIRRTMAVVLPALCPPDWTTNSNTAIDCINISSSNSSSSSSNDYGVAGVGSGEVTGTSASFTGLPQQDGVTSADGNYTFPPDDLLNLEIDSLERVVSAIVPLLFGLIGFCGLLGNALVILVVCVNQQMRSTTNLLIINLAVSDILFVIFCVPFTATDYVLPEWPFGNLWCKFVQYMIVVTCHGSVYTLVLMSLDRFLAVVHPVTSMSLRTERNAMLAIIFAWILIVTTAIPVALSHSVQLYYFKGRNYTACVFSSHEEKWNLAAFQVSFCASSYVTPLTLIFFLYMCMLARLWKSAPGCKPSAESRKGKRRVTRMVVVVVLAFAICWLPIHVILVLKAFDMYASTHVTVIIQIISHVLAYMNSCINPVLYAFLSENFRKAFWKVVWCGTPPPLINNQQITKTTRTTNCNGISNVEML